MTEENPITDPENFAKKVRIEWDKLRLTEDFQATYNLTDEETNLEIDELFRELSSRGKGRPDSTVPKAY